jgi:ABC-type uncharacterized transport system auxiliary subunit
MKAAHASVVAVLLLTGCASFRQEARPTVWVALEPARASGGLRTGGPTLEVARFASAAPFGTDRVVAREGTSRWTFASYHRWVAEPGAMVSSWVRDALSCSDLFSAVFTPPAPYRADFRLSGAVRTLFWDRSEGTAVVELEASLVAAPDRPCGFWVHRAAAPVAADNVDAYLVAASDALARTTAALRDDVAGALATCARPGGP